MTVRYGPIEALRGVDLAVQPGQVVGLLGRNGAGKSTLVSVVAGLLRPDAGSCRIGGIDPAARRGHARAGLGVAPQEIGVYPTLSVRDNLEFFGRINGLRGAKAVAGRIESVAEALSLTSFLGRKVRTLSGGEKRRVHVAGALLHRPSLVVLDEPSAGVDVETRNRLLDLVRELSESGTAVLYSTHYLAEIEALGSRVVILDGGRICADSAVDELVKRHGESWVELSFDGPPPPIDWGPRAVLGPSSAKVPAEEPGAAVARLASAVSGEGAPLLSIEIVRPSLESAFLAVVGASPASENEGGH